MLLNLAPSEIDADLGADHEGVGDVPGALLRYVAAFAALVSMVDSRGTQRPDRARRRQRRSDRTTSGGRVTADVAMEVTKQV